MCSAKPNARFELSPRVVNLFVRLAWAGSAFAIHTAFAMVVLVGLNAGVVAIYALGLAATLGVHRSTRGPVSIALAFALCFALFAEGVYFALATESGTPAARALLAVAMTLPLVLLVTRRWAIDEEDAWFAHHARRVVRGALPLAVLALVAGILGLRGAGPEPYERAVVVLGHSPFVTTSDFMPVAGDRARNDERFALFVASTSVPRAIRDEVRAECARFAGRDSGGASSCAHERLVNLANAARKRRNLFGALAAGSGVPWAFALLFAWKGRRGGAPAGARRC